MRCNFRITLANYNVNNVKLIFFLIIRQIEKCQRITLKKVAYCGLEVVLLTIAI